MYFVTFPDGKDVNAIAFLAHTLSDSIYLLLHNSRQYNKDIPTMSGDYGPRQST